MKLLLGLVGRMVGVSAYLIISAAMLSAQDYSWLNGKWYGDALMGGQIELELQVAAGNKVKGKSQLRVPGRRSPSNEVEGNVDGNKVELTWGPSRNTTKISLTYIDGELVGDGTNENTPQPVKTTYKKLAQ